uniref:Uncharacterized protein n=1 Tax=Cannabis sativa TaxID=3483 RepID=A0A803QHX7_CANSA
MEYIAIFIAFVFPGALVAFNHNLPQSLIAMVCYLSAKRRPSSSIFCSAQPSQSNIKVIINGAAKEIQRAAVIAVTKVRGMEVAGAVDSYLVGEDIGKNLSLSLSTLTN